VRISGRPGVSGQARHRPDPGGQPVVAGVALGAESGGHTLRPPLVAYLPALEPVRAVVATRWPRCVSAACRRLPLSASGRRAGLGATPPFPPEKRPRSSDLPAYFPAWSGSLPARACGAIDPCGKASNPPVGSVRIRRSNGVGSCG